MGDIITDWSKIEILFDEALERPCDERESFVHRSANGDAALASEVLTLLDAADSSDDFLTEAHPPASSADAEGERRLGAWQIVAPLGRGGMGEVYEVARADGEYRQRAALKRMRPLPEIQAARFQTERQILAELDHPGIARLLDGGLAEDGRPFMVIEFVEGCPIDVHCERVGLGPRDRISLIVEAADAITYAHGKLIVHRDIKPSNILVSTEGRTRLIDFGVARLITPGLDGATELPISIEYVAPELLEGRSATTASDVYGLAATLYELLAGHPPVDVAGLAIGAAVHRIAEDAPPPLGENAIPSDTALRRDVAAILARALRKEPAARYPTVEAFAADLARALDGRPVTARRSDRGYVIGRFLRRRKWPIAAIVSLVLALAVGLGIALWQAEEARLQRDAALREQARSQAVQQYLHFMLRSSTEAGGANADVGRILEGAAERIIEQFDRDPVRSGPVLHALGEFYFNIADYEAAAPLLHRLTETPGVAPELVAAATYNLAQIRLRQARADEATTLLTRAQSFWSAEPDRWESELIDSRLVEARLLRTRGEIEQAIELLRRNLVARSRLSGPKHRETGVYHNDLGVMLTAAGRRDEAIGSFQSALDVWRANGLDNSTDALKTLNNLAALHVLSGRPEAAEPLFRRAVELRRQLYGESAVSAALLSNYGKTLIQLERFAEAVPVLEEAVAMARTHAGTGSLHYASATAGLSRARFEAGELGRAAREADQALADVRAVVGEDHPAVAVLKVEIGRLRAAQGRTEQADRLLTQAQSVLAALGAAGAPQIETIERIRARYHLPRS